ncbi:MAG: hypothetical protein AB7F64_05230, partial [Gammaproteobacteria bacterium]
YFMLQYNKLKANTYLFSSLNVIGSCLILYSLFFAWNLSSALIEIAWILISCFGIFKKWQSNNK